MMLKRPSASAKSGLNDPSPWRTFSGEAPIAWAMATANIAFHVLPPCRPPSVAGISAVVMTGWATQRSISMIASPAPAAG
jgi:hypothetical protein